MRFPSQHTLPTRAGCECVAHVLNGICKLDPSVSVSSVSRERRFDVVSRRAMLNALFGLLEMGCCALPFVQSSCWCEDDAGVARRNQQGEGNKASVHLLIALEEHGPLQAMQWQIQDCGRLVAKLDDVSRSERVETVCSGRTVVAR